MRPAVPPSRRARWTRPEERESPGREDRPGLRSDASETWDRADDHTALFGQANSYDCDTLDAVGEVMVSVTVP